MARAPATATRGASAAAGLVGAGPDPRSNGRRRVGRALPTPLTTAVAVNWAVISRCAPELDARAAVPQRGDIAASEEALEESREATAADTQVAVTAAGQVTARARDTLQQVRDERVKIRREEAAVEQGRAATTRPAPGVTSTGSGGSSAKHDAPPSFSTPSAALAAPSGSASAVPERPGTRHGANKRPQDRAFLQGSGACISRSPQSVFALDEAMAVMQSAEALLLELPEERLLSVHAAWRLARADSWEG